MRVTRSRTPLDPSEDRVANENFHKLFVNHSIYAFIISFYFQLLPHLGNRTELLTVCFRHLCAYSIGYVREHAQ